jgi:hypothetical protein
MLEVGGVAHLRAKLGQYASMELRKQKAAIAIPNFASIKSCFHLNAFLMA